MAIGNNELRFKVKKWPQRVLRGGSWINNARNCRSAYRNHNQRDNANDNIGLRVAQLLFKGEQDQH